MDSQEQDHSHTGELVVVGSSAGGIEALSTLVSTLPPNFSAPIVLAQHLDPHHVSNLAAILQRRTPLVVEEVTSSILMEPGKIYVVPADRHVIIADGHVAVREDQTIRPRPSVDRLLTTAAENYGERLISVILTGSGSDGAAGSIAVKRAGGTVIIQNPATALYPAMPLALPATIVDFESDIEGIGPLLNNLLTGVQQVQIETKPDSDLQAILDQVSSQAKLDFKRYKTMTIVRRIQRRMVVVKVQTMQEYAQFLETHPDEIGSLVSAFLINVTGFFRDEQAFAYLKGSLLPKLIARARERGGDRILRFWSAGCATGEEPYSLAMLLSELLGAELSEWTIKIFATDLDEAAINFARRGIYAEQLLQDIPESYKQQYFERVEAGYRISKALRQMLVFGQHNLTEHGPFPDIDLVVCRNVLIYFSITLQQEVLNRFAFALSPDGYLFLGKAETVSPSESLYEITNKKYRVYHCVGRNLSKLGTLAPPRRSHLPSIGAHATTPGNITAPGELVHLRRFNEVLLRFLPLGVVVIDSAYRLLSANSTVRRLLGLYDTAAEQDQDFLHAMHGVAYGEVRAAIDKAFRERGIVVVPEIELNADMGGSGRFVSLTIAFLEAEASQFDLAAISVSDVTQQVNLKQQLKSLQTEQIQLMEELRTANKYVNDRNQELLTTNERLQTSNEELLLAHEELQASIEEFETTNEELQATNEELETANEEAQAVNEELQTINEESIARNRELEELTDTLISERKRLSEIVERAPFYMMVLRGPELIIQAFSPRYAQFISNEQIQGQPLAEVADLLWVTGTTVTNLSRQAYRQDIALTTHRLLMRVSDPDGRMVERDLILNLIPSHDLAGRVQGLVLYATDITEQQIKVIEDERERLRLIFDSVPQVAFALFDAKTVKLIIASSRYLDEIDHSRLSNPREVMARATDELGPFLSIMQANELWEQVVTSRKPLGLPEVQYPATLDTPETIWTGTLTPIMDTQDLDKVCYVLLSSIEITDQVHARQALEQLDKLKDGFLSVATHELRTPMTSITGSAVLLQRELLKRQAAESSGEGSSFDFQRAERLVNIIVHQANQMNRLTAEMLEKTRIETGQFEVVKDESVDLVAMVRRVAEQHLEIHSHHPILLEVGRGSFVGNFDETRLEQVLNNLISNACKYSPANTPVVVGIERGRAEQNAADEVVIWVRDQGYGISEDQKAHIFDRFYRARTQETAHVLGIGLGLYISHEIVTRSGGRMWVESQPGQGSTFFIALPLATAAA